MKTVTIKLRIHKLLAEKRLTKYRFIAMTGLAIKMPAGFWTMKLNPSASAPSPASAPHWTVRPAIYLKFMRKKILTMECIKHSETSDFMCGSHAKKELSTDGFAPAFVTALFGDPIFK